MKTLLYLGSLGSDVSTYGTNLLKICCLIITVFLGLSACVDVPPPPPPLTNIRIASVSVDASPYRAIWKTRANKRAYVSAQKLEKAVASAVQRRVSPLAKGSRAVVVTLTVTNVTFNYQTGPFDLGGDPSRLHSQMFADLKIADAQSGEILSFYGGIFTQYIIHEKKWPFPKDIQWSENEVNKNLGELAMDVADEVACQLYHVSCASMWTGRRR